MEVLLQEFYRKSILNVGCSNDEPWLTSKVMFRFIHFRKVSLAVYMISPFRTRRVNVAGIEELFSVSVNTVSFHFFYF